MIEVLKKQIVKRSVPFILKDMFKATDLDEVKKYEDLLIGAIISSLSVVGSILNLVVRLFWGDPLSDIIMTSIIFLFLGGMIDLIVFKIKDSIIRAVLMSLCINGILFTVTLTYYERVSTVLWTTIFLLMIISIIRIDQIIFFSLGISGIILNSYYYSIHLDDVIILNHLYYWTQMVLFLIIFIVGLLWNRLYRDRYKRSHFLFVEALEGKEEVTQLYEEIKATEEELRTQNELLNEYNVKIKMNQEELNRLIYRDELTGLVNRKWILERLQALIDSSQQSGNKFAIVFVDLDGFKKINDTMGHQIGDLYLCEVGKRLTWLLHENDTIGRFGGDEFALIVQNIDEQQALLDYVDQFREALSSAYEIGAYRIYSSASFGVSIYPDNAQKISELIKTADAAMYKAKEKGKNNIQFFRKEMKEEVLSKIELENELADATQRGEFFLVYQPQVDIINKKIRGFEALLRWESPSRGVVPPNDFVPTLEATGLINPVGDWVIEEVCKRIVDLTSKYLTDFSISVNVSSAQMQEENFVLRIKELVEIYGVPKNTLELEITESVFMDNIDDVIGKMNALKDLGIIIALDDFGTGYSSLSYLRLMPIDVLKIDKSFIWDLEKGVKEQKIVGSIIDLVHDMDIVVVAEGVESDFQYKYLLGKRCDFIQGYFISRPLDASKMDAMFLLHV